MLALALVSVKCKRVTLLRAVPSVGGDGGVRTGEGLAKLASDCSSVVLRKAPAWPPKPLLLTRALASAIAADGVVATIVK